MPVLRSADDTCRIVICRNAACVVAVRNRYVYRGAVSACRQMPDYSADSTVRRINRTNIAATLNDTFSAVTDSTDNTSAVATSIDIRTVPAIYKICTVAPFCNAAHKRAVRRTDFAAGDSYIFNNCIHTNIAKKSAGCRI